MVGAAGSALQARACRRRTARAGPRPRRLPCRLQEEPLHSQGAQPLHRVLRRERRRGRIHHAGRTRTPSGDDRPAVARRFLALRGERPGLVGDHRLRSTRRHQSQPVRPVAALRLRIDRVMARPLQITGHGDTLLDRLGQPADRDSHTVRTGSHTVRPIPRPLGIDAIDLSRPGPRTSPLFPRAGDATVEPDAPRCRWTRSGAH